MVCGAMLLVTGRSDVTLRQSEERFRSMFELAAIGIAQIAPDGKVLRVNQRFTDILGYTRDELTTVTFRDITHPDDLGASDRFVQEMLEGDRDNFSTEKRYCRKDGSIVWANLSVALVRNESNGPLYFIAVIEDISQRRHAEDLLNEEQGVLRRLIELQEAERRLVAHDIHDGFAQDVVGAQMQLQGVLGDPTSETNHADLRRIVEIMNKAIKECRRMIRDLRPMILDEAGVIDAIAHLVAEEDRNSALTVAFAHDVQFDRLDPRLEGAIFRIVQESLTNVKRHANTEHAAVELTQRNGNLDVVIRDQGVGFDRENVPTTCFGMRGILERARLFGGTARIESVPGEGTTVSAELPIDKELS
jgi:PAS domain S-box-containing protein